MELKQFDILLVNFSPTRGHEQEGVRPCVILETNGFRGQGSITLAAPLTTQLKKVFSIETVIAPSAQNGLKEKSKVLIRQLRVIDKARILKKLGRLEKRYHDSLLHSLAILFDLNRDFAD